MSELGLRVEWRGAAWKFVLGVAALSACVFAGARHASQKAQSGPATHLQDGLKKPYPAPDFVGIKAWLNSKPETIKSLRGKVVLVDFWTYSCINCLRTLPYLKAWDKKYRSQGLVIVGVHTPEFTFEKSVANIKTALDHDHIQYPVAVDSGEATWNAYKNDSWPAHYLIDKSGQVVYTHFGEGDYDVAENNIRYLLGLKGAAAGDSAPLEYSDDQTPETYLGSDRAERQVSNSITSLPMNNWSLGGKWKSDSERIVSQAPEASLRLKFNARKVYLVMGTSTGQPLNVTLKLNGAPLPNGGVVKIDGHTLYQLLDQGSAKPGLLEITAASAGVEMYAFTFGS